jgi:hypothetical protein
VACGRTYTVAALYPVPSTAFVILVLPLVFLFLHRAVKPNWIVPIQIAIAPVLLAADLSCQRAQLSPIGSHFLLVSKYLPRGS